MRLVKNRPCLGRFDSDFFKLHLAWLILLFPKSKIDKIMHLLLYKVTGLRILVEYQNAMKVGYFSLLLYIFLKNLNTPYISSIGNFEILKAYLRLFLVFQRSKIIHDKPSFT